MIALSNFQEDNYEISLNPMHALFSNNIPHNNNFKKRFGKRAAKSFSKTLL